MPNSDLDFTAGFDNPMTEDLDVASNDIISSTGDVVLDATATPSGNVVAKPDTAGKFLVSAEGGTPGTHQIAMYCDASTSAYLEYLVANGTLNYLLSSGGSINFKFNNTTKLTISSGSFAFGQTNVNPTAGMHQAIGIGEPARVYHSICVNTNAKEANTIAADSAGVKAIDWPLPTGASGSAAFRLYPRKWMVTAWSGTFTSDITISFGDTSNSALFKAAGAIFGGTPAVGDYRIIDTTNFVSTDNALRANITVAATGTTPIIKIVPIYEAVII